MSFREKGEAEDLFPALDQLHGFTELPTSCCAARWPQHVQHWHSAASELQPRTRHLLQPLSSWDAGQGSGGGSEILLQNAPDLLAEMRKLLQPLVVRLGEGRQPRCVPGRGDLCRARRGGCPPPSLPLPQHREIALSLPRKQNQD